MTERRTLLLINLYVPQENYGPCSPATQKFCQLQNENNYEPKVRNSFQNDLCGLIDQYPNSEVIVTGDFNMTNEGEIPTKLKDNYQLTDIVIDDVGKKLPRETYKYGKSRIDMVVVSPYLQDKIFNVNYSDYGEMTADHRAITFTVKFKSSLKTTNTQRKISSSCYAKSIKYRQQVWKKFQK